MSENRRSSYLSVPDGIELPQSPLIVRGYNTDGEFVCRLEINSAGVAVFAGANGQKPLCNLNWEKFVKLLEAAG